MHGYQEIYDTAIANGSSPMLADMLASRKGPGVRTETSIYADTGTLDKQFHNNQPHLRKIVEAAKKHGHTPNPNSFYDENLAQFMGDPLAFIPPGEGRSHIRKVAEKRGHDVNADFMTYKAPRKEPPKAVKLAESLVKEGMRKLVTENPDLARKPARELREAAIDRFAPKDE